MVYQGSDVLWQHIWCLDIYTMRDVLIHVLDSVWLLQPTLAVLGFRPLCFAAPPGTSASGLLLAVVSDPAEQRQYSGVRTAAYTFFGLENEQGRVHRDLRLVHPWRGLAFELHVLQAVPRSIQALAGGHFYSSRQVVDDSHCVLPLVSTTLSGGTATRKASWCNARAHRFDAVGRLLA